MIKVFDKLVDYYSYVSGGLNSGDIYFVNEDKSSHFMTNNIDGELKTYDMIQEIGGDSDSDIVATFVNLSVTENGTYDPEEYGADGFATVSVSVPVPEGYVLPSGNLDISSNASSIDVAQYSTVAVSVPVPSGYVLPSGNLDISSNASSIDVAQYETVSVSVSGGSTPSISWVNSTTAGNTGGVVEPTTAVTGALTVGKTYRIHFDGENYSSEKRYLYLWAEEAEGNSKYTDGEMFLGSLNATVNDFDITILPFMVYESEGSFDTLSIADPINVHIAIIDSDSYGSGTGQTYAFRYAELPQYPAGGPTA